MKICTLFILITTVCCTSASEGYDVSEVIKMVESCSEQFGEALWKYSETYTRRNRTIESFKNTTITNENGTLIHKEIIDNLRNMFQNKIKAVENIKTEAEILSYNRKKPIETNSSYSYYNTDHINQTVEDIRNLTRDILQNEKQWKCDRNNFQIYPNKGLKEKRQPDCDSIPHVPKLGDYFFKLPLEYDSHFKTRVNTNISAVRVSPAVYWREREALNDIRWSEALDIVFKKNFENDPTLTWQFFGSPKGFMRLYPAMQWSDEKYDKTYDFRIRAWFTEAMTSPKDVVILLDKSGSMKGTRRFMSRYIINDILDTLYDNDFINIYLFDNTTTPLVECFGDSLVQANEENLRLLREKLGGYQTKFPGDLGRGLERAFKLLAKYRFNSTEATQCNQIILIITEGVDYDYRPELFKIYNSDRHVRIFTYQIGQEPADQVVLEWIACANMGYYVNMTFTADAHEKVLKYLTVMSRPVNLYAKTNNPRRNVTMWSALYVDLADRRLTNWLWEKYQGNRQRDKFFNYATMNAKTRGLIFTDKYHYLQHKDDHPYEEYRTPRKHTFLTTISMPVYDFRENETDLLGVAAVDVSRDFINSLIAHYRIGVNGYAFIVTNNGYLILHPDHRTEFEHILKPTFNRVDMVEVEIMDDDTKPRLFNSSTIVKLRENILKELKGRAQYAVRTHVDEMKRIILSQRHYFYGPLGPFSLIIALPEGYGFWNVEHNHKHNYRRVRLRSSKNRTWSIHPEWHYCKKYGHTGVHESPEDELLDFLKNINKSGMDIPEKHCDKRLIKSFLGDFAVTEWFDEEFTKSPNMSKEIYNFPIIRVFLATHTGLTRWQDIDEAPQDLPNHFGRTQNKATDEVWYQRAAHENYKYEVFIYAIPFGSNGNLTDINVTASNVIFVKSGNKRAPVAAIGFQFYQKFLASLFRSKTSSYRTENNKRVPCDKGSLVCFVLDNNGFIIVSEDDDHVGLFFGRVRSDIMNMLVRDGIYKRIRFFDYQAICYFDPVKESSGRRHFSFIPNLLNMIVYIFSSLLSLVEYALGFADWKEEIRNQTKEFEAREIKKQVPTPCDREMYLYTFLNESQSTYHFGEKANWYYVARKVPKSNLLFVLINGVLPQNKSAKLYSPEPRMVTYGDELLPCYIATKNNFTRRKEHLPCFQKDPSEEFLNKDKTYCGGEGNIKHDSYMKPAK